MSTKSVATGDALVNPGRDHVLAAMRMANQIIHVCGSPSRRLAPVLSSDADGLGDDAESKPRDYVGEVTR